MGGHKFTSLVKAFFINHWGGLVVALGLSHLIIGGYLGSMKFLPVMFGQETISTVVEKKPVKVSRRTVSYRVVYEFQDRSGATIIDEGPISHNFFNELKEGDKLKTTYLSIMPAVHFIEGGLTSGIGIMFTLMGVVITFIGSLLFLHEIRKVRDSEPDNIMAR